MDPGVEMLPVLLLRSFTPPPPEMGGGVGGGAAPPSVEEEFELELAASTLEAAHMSNMVVELEAGLVFSGGPTSRLTSSAVLLWAWVAPAPALAVPPPICWGSR